MDSTNGRRVSCLCHPPVSTLVLMGKPEQTQRTGPPDLLGQQTCLVPCARSGAQSRGAAHGAPHSPGAGTESRPALFPSLSLPAYPRPDGCSGRVWGSFLVPSSSLHGPALFT